MYIYIYMTNSPCTKQTNNWHIQTSKPESSLSRPKLGDTHIFSCRLCGIFAGNPWVSLTYHMVLAGGVIFPYVQHEQLINWITVRMIYTYELSVVGFFQLLHIFFSALNSQMGRWTWFRCRLIWQPWVPMASWTSRGENWLAGMAQASNCDKKEWYDLLL